VGMVPRDPGRCPMTAPPQSDPKDMSEGLPRYETL
jgi:hypothetical protein